MPLTESLKAQAIRELRDTVCSICGSAKLTGHSFCKKCFFQLDAPTRSGLYSTMSEHYAERYDEAKGILKAEVNS